MNSFFKGIMKKNMIITNTKNYFLKDSFYNKFLSKKHYHPVKELMTKYTPTFYSDPNQIGEEIIRIFCLHDKITDPSKVTLNATFSEMGLDSLDFVECILEVENYLLYDFGPSDWEQFMTINDIAQFLSKDYFAQKH